MDQPNLKALNDLSTEDLRIKWNFLCKEAEELKKIQNDKNASLYQKRAVQSDLESIGVCLSYIEELLSERAKSTGRTK